MAKVESKTKPTDVPVEEYLEIVSEKRQKESKVLIEIMKDISGMNPVMWGSSMIGFGSMRYESKYATGSMPLLAFAPRKAKFTVYLGRAEQYEHLLEELGKHKTGVGCLYINKLEDVDLKVLKEILIKVWDDSIKEIES